MHITDANQSTGLERAVSSLLAAHTKDVQASRTALSEQHDLLLPRRMITHLFQLSLGDFFSLEYMITMVCLASHMYGGYVVPSHVK